jgi:hypothetical protein
MRYDITLPETSIKLFRDYLTAALEENGFDRVFSHYDPEAALEITQFRRDGDEGEEIVSVSISPGDIVRRVVAECEHTGIIPLLEEAFKKTAGDWLKPFLEPLVEDPSKLDKQIGRWLEKLIEDLGITDK